MSTIVKKMKMVHEQDPKQYILDQLSGEQDKIDLFGARVLVATYIRPEKTVGGIIITENTRREDQFQGRVGLVLKLGPAAFQDSSEAKFYGKSLKPGDWAYYRPSDGVGIAVNGVMCRIIEDVMIDGTTEDVDVVL
jgi:co-chaperonin GroES (HSP10)